MLPGPQPRLLADSPIRMDATLQLNEATRPLELTADHRLFALQARAITAGAQSATLHFRLPDLAPLAAFAGQRIHGQTELEATLKQTAATTRLNLEANTELAHGATLLLGMLEAPFHQLEVTLTDRTVEVDRIKPGRTRAVALFRQAAPPSAEKKRARHPRLNGASALRGEPHRSHHALILHSRVP